jgi:putative cell wall-binding protein
VCLQLDNSTSQNLQFTEASTTFTVTGGANTTGLSATTGPGTVVTYPSVGNTILGLPVSTPSAAGQAATWVASNLSLATAPVGTNLSEGQSTGVTESDGPVWAYVYWVSGPDPSCLGVVTAAPPAPAVPKIDLNPVTAATGGGQPTDPLEIGYVQLSTVSELANSIYGASQVGTAAEAIGHQFNYAAGDCVGPGAEESGNEAGGVLFVATDADYHDALGAAYPAGADDSAVALTDPGSLSIGTANIIRQEGVQTVYLVGGPLAISNNVQNQLESTTSYLCGGVEPRINALGGTEDLTVIRIAGQTADDTNLQLADFPGAQPITPTPGPFGAYAAPTAFNDTGSGTGTGAPTGVTQNTAILVTDADFPDAVSGSALAYGWPMPLIVTTPGALDTDALEAIFNDHINQVIVLGGVLAVTPAVISELPAGVTAIRVAGIDGSDTSTELASFELSTALGIGVDNNDPQWGAFVDRTAGEIAPAPGFSAQGDTHAHVVLLARGDYYADAETASVLAVHNGLYGFNTTLKPLVLAESPTNLGSYVTSWLSNAGLAVSGLPGEVAAGGWANDPNPLEHASATDGLKTPSFGNQVIETPFFGKGNPGFSSSSVYTIQPIGGPLALGQGVLNAAIAAVTAG